MFRRIGVVGSAVAVAATVAVSAPALGVNLITNGSFESGNYEYNGQGAQSLQPGSTVMSGWTVTTSELAVIGPDNSFNIKAHDGGVSLDLAGYHDSTPWSGVTQDVATTPGVSYELTYWIGAYFSESKVTATAGGTSATGTGMFAAGSNEVNWTQATLDFVATSSVTTISLVGAQGSNFGTLLGLDDVSLVQTSMLAGDANLNGRIDSDDFALIDRGFSKHLTGWGNGDFNDDGVVDGADYQMINGSFAQAAHGPVLAVVPEPSGCLLLVVGGSLRRRRRHRR
jgi:hypothetical protein